MEKVLVRHVLPSLRICPHCKGDIMVNFEVVR